MKEGSRRHDLGPALMREVSRGPVESWLTKRSEWMVKSAKVQEFLAPKIKYKDKLAGKVEEGVSVLAVGAGKGHEMDEMDQLLPGSKIIGVDPHDYQTRPVGKRLEKLAHNAEYLPKDVTAENLKGVDDKSMDAITLFFVLHHIKEGSYGKIMSEANRVLKDDGYLFVAEDLVDSEDEKKVVESVDRKLNLELSKKSPHNYMGLDEWNDFFDKHGFEVVDEHEEKPEKVRHGFMVLRKKDKK